jgi:hypothetical protein
MIFAHKLSKYKSKMPHNLCPETLNFRDALSNEVTYFPAVLFVTTIHSALLGVFKTSSAQQGSVVIVVIE